MAALFLYSNQVRNIQYQLFRFSPADAGIGDGLSVDTFADGLGTALQVGFNHETLHHGLDIFRMAAGVEDFLADAWLLPVFLGGIGMVGIHDQAHIFKTTVRVCVVQTLQFLKMIVGQGIAALVHITPQNGMGQGIASGFHFPVPVDKGVAPLGRRDGIEHHGKMAAGGIFHAHGNGQAAGGEPMLLILHAPGAHGYIGQQIGNIPVIVRIEHFVRSGQSGFGQHMGVQTADGHDAFQHIRLSAGIGLMQKAHVTFTGGSGFVGIDPGNQDQFVGNLLLQACQTVTVGQNRILPVSGTGTDDQDAFIAFSGEHIGDGGIPDSFAGNGFRGQGILLLDLHGDGKLSLKVHIIHSIIFSQYGCNFCLQFTMVYLKFQYLTSAVVKNHDLLAEQGEAAGALVVADKQTAGRGRRGRDWVSPSGKDIYMTLMLRPQCRPEKASALTLVMALAVLEAICELIPEGCGIKWPNDIVLNNKKVCGILTEMSAELDGIHYVVIGVGINVNQTTFAEDIMDRATSLYLESGVEINRSRLVARVMHHFEKDYALFEKTWDLSGLIDQYNRFLVNRDREVRVLDPQGEYDGIARGINEKGELIVERGSDGQTVQVYAGEVSVRGVYGYAV